MGNNALISALIPAGIIAVYISLALLESHIKAFLIRIKNEASWLHLWFRYKHEFAVIRKSAGIEDNRLIRQMIEVMTAATDDSVSQMIELLKKNPNLLIEHPARSVRQD